jgi:hypothetical protein
VNLSEDYAEKFSRSSIMLVKFTYTLVITAILLGNAPASRAASLTGLTLLEQVQEAAKWFTGLFDNAEQVSEDPTVPLITMSNCAVELVGGNFSNNAESIYLEQNFINSAQPPRIRYYEFSEGSTGVLLGIRAFTNSQGLAGLCKQPAQQRRLNFDDIASESCEIELFLATNPRRYTGTNAPLGCPAASNPALRVISSLTIEPNQVNSLDVGFIGGVQIFGTPITFHRVPEPDLLLGLMAVGLLGLSRSKIHSLVAHRRDADQSALSTRSQDNHHG